jgi:class 3 adenylate cyclase
MATSGAWKWLLLGLCAIGFAIVCSSAADQFGFFSRPWYGFFDASFNTTANPFALELGDPASGGAATRAGLHSGDIVDLRQTTLAQRIAVLFQPLATHTIALPVRRGAQHLQLRFTGSTVWDGASQWKLAALVPELLANLWFLGCAFLIAARCFAMRDGRLLAVVLVALITWDLVGPANLAIPNGWLSTLLFIVENLAALTLNVLLVVLASTFGRRSLWRRALEWLAYGANALFFAGAIVCAIGLWTLAFDPAPFVLGAFWHIEGDAAAVAVAIAAIAAVAATPQSDRTRAVWLLLPLPIADAVSVLFTNVTGTISDWYVYVAAQSIANLALVLGAAAVTYALLNKRILDFGFVVNRTIVMGSVSVAVVAPFVLLEWLLSTFFSHLNRNATLYISAAVTLVIGVAMPRMYIWISETVERTLFARDYRARKQLARLAAGLPYAESFEAIDVTLTKAVCKAFHLPSAAVYRRSNNGTFLRESAHGWNDDEQLDAVDAQRLAMDLQGSRAMMRIEDAFVDLECLPHGYREPAVAFALMARQTLVGYVLYSGHSHGAALDPDELKLLGDVAHEASRGYDAVELASRVEVAYEARMEAETQAKETLRRSNAVLERINEAQARFMPNEFLHLLGKESITEIALGDSIERIMTVLFSDIRSFTTLSEGMTPPEIFAFLNRYLQRAEPIVSEHGGFIDKYIGDAVMGLFPTSADDAVLAGIELQREVRVLNRKLADEGEQTLAIGVGLHTGDLMLGTIGGRNRMETTVIADAVNTASRLESATKTFGCGVILSAQTRAALRDPGRFLLRDLGSIHVKGKHEGLQVFEAFDAEPAEVVVHKQQTMPAFAEALAHYEAAEFAIASAAFAAIAAKHPSDGPARFYAGLADEMRTRVTA